MVLPTASTNESVTDPPLPSDAVTLIVMLPVLALDGVPEKVRVDAVNVNQDGREAPPCNVAVYVSGSLFGSENVLRANVKLKRAPTAPA